MTRLDKAAMTAAVLLSAVSIMDAVYKGLTGGAEAVWDDGSGNRWAVAATTAVMALTFPLLAGVLVERAEAIDGNGRVVPRLRGLLVAALSALGAVFLAGVILGGYPGPLEATAGIAFLTMFVVGAGLGVALLRRPELRLSALLMVSPVVLLPAAVLVNVLAPGWGHPAYAETTLYIGLALLARPLTAHPDSVSSTPKPVTTHL